MTLSRARVALLAAGVAAVLPALAQVGHPVKGSWSGYWGPSEDEQHRVLLLLDWEDRGIVGTINPGRNGVEIDSAELDPSTWTLTLEADMPVGDGGTERWVATGKLENLGSWNNRLYSGTYRHGEETGTFEISIN